MSLFKRYWLKWNLKRHARGGTQAMDHAYLVEDPWGLKGEGERIRFEETTRIIRRTSARSPRKAIA